MCSILVNSRIGENVKRTIETTRTPDGEESRMEFVVSAMPFGRTKRMQHTQNKWKWNFEWTKQTVEHDK